MATRFSVQNEPFPNLYWATCSWNIGAALFPLLFVPLTENTGRMPGYFVRLLGGRITHQIANPYAGRLHRVRIVPVRLSICR